MTKSTEIGDTRNMDEITAEFLKLSIGHSGRSMGVLERADLQSRARVERKIPTLDCLRTIKSFKNECAYQVVDMYCVRCVALNALSVFNGLLSFSGRTIGETGSK